MPTVASTKTRRAQKNNFHTLLVFRCASELSEALADLAAHRGTSVSAIIRDLLLEGMRNT